ncbi:hypothetical protein [Pseudoalteromonas spongiae]|uniref:hypothetical protein n=1 Tax=Pseudoalteromonas spongiae TaxID=298657 RepID=UPI000C2D0BF5|nr:hypothetical protein [Pseudoalteromonas spongiae]
MDVLIAKTARSFEEMTPVFEAEKVNEVFSQLQKQIADLEKAVVEEIENRDKWEEKATYLAECVGVYFDESVGEHSSANCPIANAHDLLNQI